MNDGVMEFSPSGNIMTSDTFVWQARQSGRSRPAPPASTAWGRLHLLERLGEGAFVEVYRAFDPRLHREVALNVLRPGVSSEPLRIRVMRESRNLARVRHANVVAVHGAQAGVRRAGFWMELVRGATLAQLLRLRSPFAPEDARKYAPGTHQSVLLVRLPEPGRSALAERVSTLFRTEAVET